MTTTHSKDLTVVLDGIPYVLGDSGHTTYPFVSCRYSNDEVINYQLKEQTSRTPNSSCKQNRAASSSFAAPDKYGKCRPSFQCRPSLSLWGRG
ncbi:hypothetical protein TNCV_3890611 [Trichonephila clavipes]|nr:hypothetical protein TNCV_3890611 [Trichonephila clavipes]